MITDSDRPIPMRIESAPDAEAPRPVEFVILDGSRPPPPRDREEVYEGRNLA